MFIFELSNTDHRHEMFVSRFLNHNPVTMNITQAFSPKYAFDMISGATIAPSSTSIKQFIDHIDGKEFVMCYVEKRDSETGNWKIVPTDYQALKENLGADPFSLAEDNEPNPYLDRLYNEFRFVFGFKASTSKSGLGGPNGIIYKLRWLYPSMNGQRMLMVEQ